MAAERREVRVMANGKVRDHVSKVGEVISGVGNTTAGDASYLVRVCGTGRAVSKVLTVVEISKRLHQDVLVHQVTSLDEARLEGEEGAPGRPVSRITVDLYGVLPPSDEQRVRATPGYQSCACSPEELDPEFRVSHHHHENKGR